MNERTPCRRAVAAVQFPVPCHTRRTSTQFRSWLTLCRMPETASSLWCVTGRVASVWTGTPAQCILWDKSPLRLAYFPWLALSDTPCGCQRLCAGCMRWQEFYAQWCNACRALFPKVGGNPYRVRMALRHTVTHARAQRARDPAFARRHVTPRSAGRVSAYDTSHTNALQICKIMAENPDVLFLKVNFDDNRDACRTLSVKGEQAARARWAWGSVRVISRTCVSAPPGPCTCITKTHMV